MNENLLHPGLNENDMLEFALRLATHPGDSRTQNAQLLPGQLPDPLPVAIPFPGGSRVLGSVINNPESISMYFDTHLIPRLALNFYVQYMQDEGWQTTSVYRPHRGGFMNPGFQNSGGSETFYKDLYDPALSSNASRSTTAWGDEGNRNRSGPVLVVNAYPGKGDVTDLRLHLEMNGPFPPGAPPHMRGRPSRNHHSLLPALEAPAEANYTAGGFSRSGLDSAQTDTTLETNRDLSALAAHYKAQLEQAGCLLTEEGQSGPLVAITWMLEEDGEQWRGVLIILKESKQEYYLTMRMRSDHQDKAVTDAGRE